MEDSKENKEKKNDILSHQELEEIVNKKAQEIAKAQKLPSNCRFRVYIVEGETPLHRIMRGTTVNIYMVGLSVLEQDFWDRLRRAIRKVPEMQEPYQLEVRNTMLEYRDTFKRGTKIRFKNDLMEVFDHLIPRDQLKVIHKVTHEVIVMETRTKKSVTYTTHEYSKEIDNETFNRARFHLSSELLMLRKQEMQEEINQENNDGQQ